MKLILKNFSLCSLKIFPIFSSYFSAHVFKKRILFLEAILLYNKVWRELFKEINKNLNIKKYLFAAINFFSFYIKKEL